MGITDLEPSLTAVIDDPALREFVQRETTEKERQEAQEEAERLSARTRSSAKEMLRYLND